MVEHVCPPHVGHKFLPGLEWEHKRELKDTKITEIQFTGHHECRVRYFKQILRLTDLKFHPNRVCIVNSCSFPDPPNLSGFPTFPPGSFGKSLILQMDLQDRSSSMKPLRQAYHLQYRQASNNSGRDALVELRELERSFQDDLTEWREKLEECRVFSAFSYLITVM